MTSLDVDFLTLRNVTAYSSDGTPVTAGTIQIISSNGQVTYGNSLSTLTISSLHVIDEVVDNVSTINFSAVNFNATNIITSNISTTNINAANAIISNISTNNINVTSTINTGYGGIVFNAGAGGTPYALSTVGNTLYFNGLEVTTGGAPGIYWVLDGDTIKNNNIGPVSTTQNLIVANGLTVSQGGANITSSIALLPSNPLLSNGYIQNNNGWLTLGIASNPSTIIIDTTTPGGTVNVTGGSLSVIDLANPNNNIGIGTNIIEIVNDNTSTELIMTLESNDASHIYSKNLMSNTPLNTYIGLLNGVNSSMIGISHDINDTLNATLDVNGSGKFSNLLTVNGGVNTNNIGVSTINMTTGALTGISSINGQPYISGDDVWWESSGSNNISTTNSGNVGIGIYNPTAKLEVNGNVSTIGDLDVTGYLSTHNTLTVFQGGSIINGNVSTIGNLDVTSTLTTSTISFLNNPGSNGKIQGNLTLNNIGINIVPTTNALDVTGTTYLSNNLTVGPSPNNTVYTRINGFLGINRVAEVQFDCLGSAIIRGQLSTTNILTVTSGGASITGTTNITGLLNVNDGVNTNTIGVSTINMTNNNTGAITGLSSINGQAYPSGDDTYWKSTGGNNISSFNTGNVGIGIVPTNAKLEVNGNVSTIGNLDVTGYLSTHNTLNVSQGGANIIGDILFTPANPTAENACKVELSGSNFNIYKDGSTDTCISNNAGNLILSSNNTILCNDLLNANKNISVNSIADDISISINASNGNFGTIEAFQRSNTSIKKPLILNGYGGNVGINTINPVSTLDVNGTGRFSGTGNNIILNELYIENKSLTSSSVGLQMYTGNDHYGIYMTTAEGAANLSGTTPSTLQIYSYFNNDTNINNTLTIFPTGTILTYNTLNVNANGNNIGGANIHGGTTNIFNNITDGNNGGLRVVPSTAGSASGITLSNYDASSQWSIQNNNGGNFEMYRYTYGGTPINYLQISPTTGLTVNKDTKINGYLSTTNMLTVTSGGANINGITNIGTSGNGITVNANGYLGIMNSNPSYQFDCTGAARITSNLSTLGNCDITGLLTVNGGVNTNNIGVSTINMTNNNSGVITGLSSINGQAYPSGNDTYWKSTGGNNISSFNTGNVGIGIVPTNAKLEINGSMNSYEFTVDNTDPVTGRTTLTVPSGTNKMYFEMVGAGGGNAGGGYIKGSIETTLFVNKVITIQVAKIMSVTESSTASFISFIADSTLIAIAGSGGKNGINPTANGGYGGGGIFTSGIASGGTGLGLYGGGGGTTVGGIVGIGGVSNGSNYANNYMDSLGGNGYSNGSIASDGGSGYTGGGGGGNSGGTGDGGGGGGSSYINTGAVSLVLSYNGRDFSNTSLLSNYGRNGQNGYVKIIFDSTPVIPSLKTSTDIQCVNNLIVNGAIISSGSVLFSGVISVSGTSVISYLINNPYITGYVRVVILAVGGGGGGGGHNGNQGFNTGAGGGASGQEVSNTYYVPVSESLIITIGAGGAGYGGSSTGGGGGPTSVISNSIKIYVNGGYGGNTPAANDQGGGGGAGYYGGGGGRGGPGGGYSYSYYPVRVGGSGGGSGNPGDSIGGLLTNTTTTESTSGGGGGQSSIPGSVGGNGGNSTDRNGGVGVYGGGGGGAAGINGGGGGANGGSGGSGAVYIQIFSI